MEQDKYDIFVDLATDTIEKCLAKLMTLNSIKDAGSMLQFARGLASLAGYRDLARKKDLPFMEKPPTKRPGIGLSRGFGEFECGDEVMEAVRKLERYYHSM
jgi:hypothetical protein